MKHLLFLSRSVTSVSGHRFLQDVGDTKIGRRSAPAFPQPRRGEAAGHGCLSSVPSNIRVWVPPLSARRVQREVSGADVPASPGGGARGTQSHRERARAGGHAALFFLPFPPRHWLTRSLSTFLSHFWGAGQGRGTVLETWPQAAQRLMRENTRAQEVMPGGCWQGLGCPEGSWGAAVSRGFWEYVGPGCVSRARPRSFSGPRGRSLRKLVT